MRRPVVGLLALLAVTVAAYARVVWTAPFVYEDVFTLKAGALWPTLGAMLDVPGRQFAALTFALNTAVTGYAPVGWHAVNLALHLVNGILVWRLAARWLAWDGALVAAAVFLLHPLQTEAVSYVSGRPELLACLWTLASVEALLAPVLGLRQGVALGLAVLFAASSKETGLVVLALLPLVWLAARRPITRAAVCASSVLAAGVIGWGHGHLVALVTSAYGRTGPLLDAWAFQSAAIWRYLALVVVPIGQSVDHDIEVIPAALQLVALVGVLLLPLCVWRLWIRWPVAALGVAWLLVALSPRLLVPIHEFLNEHQMYVPMVGIALLVGAAFEEIRDVRVVG
jgi:hypothetical protein